MKKILLNFIFVIFLFASCKTDSVQSSLYTEYSKIDNINVCEKIDFFEKYLNTKKKQTKNYSDFRKIISDIEQKTGIVSNTDKGFIGVVYMSNSDITSDIRKWKEICW